MTLVEPEGFEAIPMLRDLLARTLAEFQGLREQRLVEAPLSEQKVQAFRDELVRGWREASILRAAIARSGRIQVVEGRPPAVLFRGYNTLERKDAFTEEEHLSAEGLAREYGRGLSRMEDELVVDALSAELALVAPELLSGEPLLASCDRALADFESRGLSPTILAVDAWGAIRTLSTSPDFRYLDRTEGGASAEYRGSPVFQLYEGPESALYVVDLDKVGELRTYGPDEDVGDGEFLAEAIFFSIGDISEARARELLAQQPQLALSDSDEPLEQEEAVRRLQQRVHLRALEAVEYVVTQPAAGLRLLAEPE